MAKRGSVGRRATVLVMAAVCLVGPASAAGAGVRAAGGDAPSGGVTRRVSVGAGGVQANDFSFRPAISVGGRYVAFVSAASNLVPGDTNNTLDVFVRDRRAGVTRRVSVGRGGAQANADSFGPAAVSAGGRYVVFASSASNLVPGDTNNTSDVFVRDRG